MSNGSNNYDVSFPQINFINGVLNAHRNIVNFTRTNDILFDLQRRTGDQIQLVCLNEYTCGVTRIIEVLEDFPDVDIIYVGGAWNGYTTEAKKYCLEASIGLYNAKEINGALYKYDFWTYVRKDRD